VSYWGYFLEFTGLSGDQILESRKADKEYSWEKRVMEFKNWLITVKHLGEKTASTATAAVRGFFSYHRLTLQFRRSESAKLNQGEPKFEDYRFSREDLKKMCDVADLTEQYVITAGKSFGLRAGDFIKLRRGDLENLDRPVPISIGDLTTSKEKVKAYPFIDGDALPVIKLMIEKMDRENLKEPNERVLRYSHEIQLSRILQRVADKAGIKYGNKRVRFHCLRKFLIDRLSSHMSESKWKQIVGKKISDSAYVSPEGLREDYNRAMTETCFKATEGDVATTAKIEALKVLAKNMGITDEELSTLATKRKPFRMTEYIKELEATINKRKCTDGEHCEKFEQINETQLLDYLRKGWVIVHKLGNGDVVVKSG